MQIPFQILNNNKTILGMIHVPTHRANGSPVVLTCYGLGGNRSEVHRMAVSLGRMAESMGVTVVRFDYLGSGLSEGEFCDSAISSKTGDVLSIVSFLKGCFQDEDFKIILLGFSDGCQVITQLLSSKAVCIDGIALWNPILFPVEDFVNFDGNVKRLQREPLTNQFVMPYYGLYVGTKYLRELKTGVNSKCITEYSNQILYIFGECDRLTSKYRLYLESSEIQPNVTIRTISGAGHLFNSSRFESEVINYTLEWAIRATGNTASSTNCVGGV